MSLFRETEYLPVLRAQLRKGEEIRGYQTRLAKVAGVHGSYLSRVLAGRVPLTPDQAARLARFWEFPPDETDYFLALVHLARAGSPELRAALERTLADLRRRHEEISGRYRAAKQVPAKDQALYYSVWHVSAVHMCLLVPGHQTVAAIAGRLGIPTRNVTDSLAILRELGLAEPGAGARWRANGKFLHLDRESPWIPAHHAAWRTRALARVQENSPEALHFTAVQAVSRADFRRIRALLIDTVDRVRPMALASAEEDIYLMTVDWLRV